MNEIVIMIIIITPLMIIIKHTLSTNNGNMIQQITTCLASHALYPSRKILG